MVSFYVALTGRQGVLILVEGEKRDNRQPWNASEQGLLASKLELPGAIRLDRLNVSFDEKNSPSEVSSDISIADGSGRVESLTASINRISRYHGLRIYHATQYGDAFTVLFTDKGGATHAEKIMIQQPVSLTDAGYSDDFRVDWSPHLFSAKYFADAARRSMHSNNPQLFVRVLDGKREIARTVLTPGETGQLGEYQVRLAGVEKWTKLIVVDITGMPLIFTGFAVIMLGGLMQYMTPPRELIAIRQDEDHYRVYWKALSFREFYAEERDVMKEALKKGAV
jgi:cytochrome c biogenesis protein ResB